MATTATLAVSRFLQSAPKGDPGSCNLRAAMCVACAVHVGNMPNYPASIVLDAGIANFFKPLNRAGADAGANGGLSARTCDAGAAGRADRDTDVLQWLDAASRAATQAFLELSKHPAASQLPPGAIQAFARDAVLFYVLEETSGQFRQLAPGERQLTRDVSKTAADLHQAACASLREAASDDFARSVDETFRQVVADLYACAYEALLRLAPVSFFERSGGGCDGCAHKSASQYEHTCMEYAD